MNTQTWISAITAFLITSCGALGVVFVGNTPSAWQVGAAIILGIAAAAKDVRSLLKLPPVDGGTTNRTNGTNPPLGLWLVLGLAALLLFPGCAGSYDRQVFRIESAALGTADGAMRGYALYYKAATNNPAAFNRTIESLTVERDQVKAYSVQVGASGEMVEALRLSYKTNAAVKPALQAGVATLTANMAGMVSFVTNIIHIKPLN